MCAAPLVVFAAVAEGEGEAAEVATGVQPAVAMAPAIRPAAPSAAIFLVFTTGVPLLRYEPSGPPCPSFRLAPHYPTTAGRRRGRRRAAPSRLICTCAKHWPLSAWAA